MRKIFPFKLLVATVWIMLLLAVPSISHAQEIDFPLSDAPNIEGGLAEPVTFYGNYCGGGGGVSLYEAPDQTFDLQLIGTPVHAYFVWSGQASGWDAAGDETILIGINGNGLQAVTAPEPTRVEAKSNGNFTWFTYAAPAGEEQLAQLVDGANTIRATGLDLAKRHGVGLLVITEDLDRCPFQEFSLFFGNDVFYHGWTGSSGPNSEVTCVEFPPPADPVEIDLQMFVGDVDDPQRSNAVWIESGDGSRPDNLVGRPEAIRLTQSLRGLNGDQLDNFDTRVQARTPIVADVGDTWACVQIESPQEPFAGMDQGVSANWINLAVSVPLAEIRIDSSGVRAVGVEHTFKVTVHSSFGFPESLKITPTVEPAPDSLVDTCGAPDIAGSQATCTITINSSQPGKFTATAEAEIGLNQLVAHVSTNSVSENSGPATAAYVTSPGIDLQVDSTADWPDANPGDGLCDDGYGECTLRAALQEIGASSVSDLVTVSSASDLVNEITFSPDISGKIVLSAPLPDIGYDFFGLDVVIAGPGTNVLTIDGNSIYRPFFIDDSPNSVTISDLTIANGLAGDGSLIDCYTYTGPSVEVSGGAVYNEGALYLENVVLLHNEADLHGGGIFNAGTLDLSDVDVVGNSAGCDGGGIFNHSDSILTLTDSLVFDNDAYGYGGGIYGEDSVGSGLVDVSYSTIAGNRAAGDGGGLFNYDSAFDLTNSTVSGNYAGGNGGGVVNWSGSYGARTRVASSTITDNQAVGNGGGIVNGHGATSSDALVEIKNSIVAGNRNGDGQTPDCAAEDFFTFVSDHTLVGNNSGCEAGFVNGADGNLVGDSAAPLDPLLGRLYYNGGAAPAHSLLTTSPALDAGDDAGCTSVSGIALPSDQRGAARHQVSKSGYSPRCDIGAYEAGLGNVSWPAALELTLEGSGAEQTATMIQYLDQAGQSRWYKFAIQPESNLIVTLSDLPADYNIAVYKDIASAYVTKVNSTEDLVQLSAEFAPEAFSPEAFSPEAFSPEAFSPEAFSPEAFSPEAFSPEAFSPEAFSPEAFSPEAFSPEAFSPEAFSPEAFSPEAFSPEAFSPEAFSPEAFSPEAFSSAQARSVIGVSAFPGLAGEGIKVRTWNNNGNFYVRVTGRNGAFQQEKPFRLDVQMETKTCTSVTSTLPEPSLVAQALGIDTLILADLSRMEGSNTDKNALREKLAELAVRGDVKGVVIDVGQDARVAAANSQADKHAECVFAKNLVADAIKTIVDRYWAENPTLKYLVIVGGDEVVPFFRHPDQALLANEQNYVPPVLDNTASQASLRLGYILGQDRYGSRVNLSFGSTELPIPDLAVGRLVETPIEISTLIDAYLSTTAGVVATPSSALVTGYDFLWDAATAVQMELEEGLGSAADVLINTPDISPASAEAWTADQLRTALLQDRHDLVFLAGHFSASGALAADYSTRLTAAEVAASDVDLTNTIIFSAGCHSSYNIVNAHGVPKVTETPDWAQAFAHKGATFIGGTGYQYGDTDFTEYGERLYVNFSQQLRRGIGPVAIGDALNEAKKAYLADTAQYKGIHAKSILEATLFGLPMLRVDLPNGRGIPSVDTSIVNETSAYAVDPGKTLNLRSADISVSPTLSRQTKTLSRIDGGADVVATFWTGNNGVVTNPAEPVLPKEIRNVSVGNSVLRGVGFRGGSYVDESNILPLTGAATTENRGVHAPFFSDVWFPLLPWRVNYFDALSNPVDGATRLFVTPVQHRSTGVGSITNSVRRYEKLDFRLYYSDYTADSADGHEPALAAAPNIVNVDSTIEPGKLGFGVTVVGDPAAGIQGVWVTYTANTGPWAGKWQTLDLTQDPNDSTRWQGMLTLNGTPTSSVRYVVQAVNGVGLVTMATNFGAYYVPGEEPAIQPNAAASSTTVTVLTLQPTSASGPYGASIPIAARLQDERGMPIPEQSIRFILGSQQRIAVTDSDGMAAIDLPLNNPPGQYELKASFEGTQDLEAVAVSGDTPIMVVKKGTSLIMTPSNVVARSGEIFEMVATLTHGPDLPLGQKTIFFTVSDDSNSYSKAVITDYAGRAVLNEAPLFAGTYSVNAYFGGNVPLPSGALMLEDPLFSSALANGSLTLEQGNSCNQSAGCLFLPMLRR